MGMPRISALDRLALATSSPVPTAAAGAGAGSGSGSGSGMTAGTNKPAQPNTLNIAGIASAAQTQTQAKDAAAAGQGDGADQTSMSVPKSIKIRRDNRPPPTTLFHRAYSFNGDIKILGSRGKDDDEEKEKEKEKEEEKEEEEEDEPVVKKGRGFVEKQEDVVMFEPPKESGRGTAVRPSGAGGQGVWRVGMARGMFGPRGAARR